MAQRRMFSKRITNSGRFLKMPHSSQNLYFHLAMEADDDGVVEAFKVLKLINANEDDLRVLTSKGFVKILNEDLVSVIMDWNEHNIIRPDRKVDSIYKDLLLQLTPEIKLIEAKPRADTGKITGRPMDEQWTAQVRLGKVRIGKEKINTKTPKINLSEFVSMKLSEYRNLYKQFGKLTVRRMIKVLGNYKASNDKTYKSDYHAILTWVVDKIMKEEAS